MADVAHIVSDVRARGADALRHWAVELDGVAPARAVADASGLPADALHTLADRVRRWHELQRPADLQLEVEPGVELERRWVPLESVGIYVPRGLVSTLVMCAVPAQVAGVSRIVVVTPPAGAGLVAAAAELLGVDEVWAVGGPHAIAALAYGTDAIAATEEPGLAQVAHDRVVHACTTRLEKWPDCARFAYSCALVFLFDFTKLRQTEQRQSRGMWRALGTVRGKHPALPITNREPIKS